MIFVGEVVWDSLGAGVRCESGDVTEVWEGKVDMAVVVVGDGDFRDGMVV